MNEPTTIRILTAGAPRTGVNRCAEVFADETGQPFEIEHATAPIIKQRVKAGAAEAEVVVAPLPVMEELASSGHVEPASVAPVGAVKVGVVVRNGAQEPDLSSVEAFTQAILDADAVVYNKASSGLYVAGLFERLGIADAVADRSIVVPTGAAVMQWLVSDPSARAIGFGHITEIRRHDFLGTHLVGALPDAIGRSTVYAVAVHCGAAAAAQARALVEFMSSTRGRRLFEESGVL